MEKKNYREFGKMEEEIDDLVAKHIVNPMFSNESIKRNKREGIKYLIITVLILLLGIFLLVWGISTPGYRIIKIIGFILSLPVALFTGVISHSSFDFVKKASNRTQTVLKDHIKK